MIGGPKPLAGGFSITSLPRTEAPTTTAPEAGKPVEQQERTRPSNNPVLRSLMTDGFEGQGAQGKGLALGHLKRAAKSGKSEGTSQEALQKLIGDLTKLIEQLMAQLSGKPQQPGTTPTAPTVPGNTGIVPPPPPTDIGIVPPRAE